MPYFNIVAETTENTVVTTYEPAQKRSDAYQSEAELEAEFIRQLCEQIDFANKSNGKLNFGVSNQAPKFTVCENIRGNYE